jgi:hypothetical protein
MGVGIYLAGGFEPRRASVELWLQRVGDWVDEDLAGDPVWGNLLTTTEQGERSDGGAALFVNFYPANEPVEFFVPQPGRMIVSAKTSILGPGYHIALCQILKRMGEELDITWEPRNEDEGTGDETGYFHTGDKAALEEEMLRHLQALAAILDENLRENDSFEMSLSMPIEYSFEGGPIKTIVGIRDTEWLRRVQANPRNGIDLFPWWEEGLTPRFYLGRATVEMCMNVRWRELLSDTDEWDTDENVLQDLYKAYQGDPSLPFPWREWAEILDYLNYGDELTEEVHRRAAQEPERPLLGYWRHPVLVRLADGWSITISGAMTEGWKDGNWSAWDGERTVWFSCWNVQREDTPVPANELLTTFSERTGLDGEVVEFQDDGLVGRGAIQPHEEEGREMWNLKAFSAVAGRIALCNLFYHDEADREWALTQWRALKCTRE